MTTNYLVSDPLLPQAAAAGAALAILAAATG